MRVAGNAAGNLETGVWETERWHSIGFRREGSRGGRRFPLFPFDTKACTSAEKKTAFCSLCVWNKTGLRAEVVSFDDFA